MKDKPEPTAVQITTLPRCSDEITAEWLTHVLRSGGQMMSRVKSIQARTLGGNTGLMSEIVQLSIAYESHEPTAPRSLIAKFPPTDAGSRGRGVSLGFFEGECGFYRELAENSTVRAPRCYFTRYDPTTGQFLTLLQDLSAERLGDMVTGCSKEEAAASAQALGRFHASWWNNAQLLNLGWLRSRSARFSEVMNLIPVAWPTFESRFVDKFEPRQFEILSSVREFPDGAHDLFSTGPVTLVHGDFKLDNLFFGPSGEITVADWGLVMSGPPMFDVATFLGLNLPISDRRDQEIGLIQRYVESIAMSGATGYGFDQAFDDYRVQLLGLLPQFICAGGLAEFAGPHAMDDYARGVQRVITAVIDHRSNRLI